MNKKLVSCKTAFSSICRLPGLWTLSAESTATHLSVIEYKTKKESERLAGFEAKQTEVMMEIDARVRAIKEQEEVERRQRRVAHHRYEIGVR